MTNLPNYQIPTEMRDFAEKSVDQARKAFEGFMTAAQKAAGSAEDAASNAQSNVKDMTSKAIAAAENNVNAAFDLAQKLVRAKDLQEVIALQTEFAKSQVASIQAQAKEFGAIVQNAASSATKK
jgi:phasin